MTLEEILGLAPVVPVLIIEDAADAVELIARHGLEAAQNQVHQR